MRESWCSQIAVRAVRNQVRKYELPGAGRYARIRDIEAFGLWALETVLRTGVTAELAVGRTCLRLDCLDGQCPLLASLRGRGVPLQPFDIGTRISPGRGTRGRSWIVHACSRCPNTCPVLGNQSGSEVRISQRQWVMGVLRSINARMGNRDPVDDL